MRIIIVHYAVTYVREEGFPRTVQSHNRGQPRPIDRNRLRNSHPAENVFRPISPLIGGEEIKQKKKNRGKKAEKREVKKKEDDLAWRENKNTTAKNSIGLKSVWRETNLKRLTVNIDFYTRYRRQIFIVREFNKLCTRFGGLTYAVM